MKRKKKNTAKVLRKMIEIHKKFRKTLNEITGLVINSIHNI